MYAGSRSDICLDARRTLSGPDARTADQTMNRHRSTLDASPDARDSEGWLDRYFGLTRHGTNLRTEVIACATTFLTMAYIIFVNPQILSQAGMDRGAVFVSTCLAASAT